MRITPHVCIDEYEHHRTADLYGKLRDGLPKRQGQLISIATAGEEDSPWGRLRARALRLPNAKREGCKLTASEPNGSFAYIEYSLADEDAERYEDFELVAQAKTRSRSIRRRRWRSATTRHPRAWKMMRAGTPGFSI